MVKSLLQRYSHNVPRYTSYPTAAQFHEGINAASCEAWLAALKDQQNLSLYLHVPYCHQLCWYCACHTNVANSYAPVKDYASVLANEIKLVASKLTAQPEVTFIHWGGGSPNLLKGDDFAFLMQEIYSQFKLSNTAEIAIEIDPRILTKDMVQVLAQAGVNRASLGVQDFNLHVQKAINRIQPFEMTHRAVRWLREAGIRGINFDIIYGLPGQQKKDALGTIDLAAVLQPDRIAVFGYAHVPWMKSHQKMIDETTLPNSRERLKTVQAMTRRLQQKGYVPIGLDHFAKPSDPLVIAQREKRLHRNFQGYTPDTADALLGFGASAISCFPQGFVQNLAHVKAYREAIEAGQLASCRGVAVTTDDTSRWTVIERLMCDMEADVSALLPASKSAPVIEALNQASRDGVIDFEDGIVRVTKKGRPFVRSVCAIFDIYLKVGTGRHSRAV